ncbi:MAG: four helix bundle protein [Bacteroidetes bacterium]|nr:four helix bundle protein [Bacteroidota bacterium]
MQQRSFQYAVRTVRLHEVMVRRGGAARTVAGPLLRSGTSIGANVAETQPAQSRADFIHKMTIAQKEARESHYWLRLMLDVGICREDQVSDLINETDRIIAILATILIRTRRNRDHNP